MVDEDKSQPREEDSNRKVKNDPPKEDKREEKPKGPKPSW